VNDLSSSLQSEERRQFAHECHIRDLYSTRIREFRPDELLLETEHTFVNSPVRADMRTVDRSDVLRIWEFKIRGGYDGLGQVLTYLALERLQVNFAKPVKAVFAAFSFMPEVLTAVEVLNLGVECVVIPNKLSLAGGVPLVSNPDRPPLVIPNIPIPPSPRM
jgi:hypothetical protein